jgi:hypothetical protein
VVVGATQMVNLKAGLCEKGAVPDFRLFEPSLISLKLPRGASFFRLKPDLATFEFFFNSIRVFPGDSTTAE